MALALNEPDHNGHNVPVPIGNVLPDAVENNIPAPVVAVDNLVFATDGNQDLGHVPMFAANGAAPVLAFDSYQSAANGNARAFTSGDNQVEDAIMSDVNEVAPTLSLDADQFVGDHATMFAANGPTTFPASGGNQVIEDTTTFAAPTFSFDADQFIGGAAMFAANGPAAPAFAFGGNQAIDDAVMFAAPALTFNGNQVAEDAAIFAPTGDARVLTFSGSQAVGGVIMFDTNEAVSVFPLDTNFAADGDTLVFAFDHDQVVEDAANGVALVSAFGGDQVADDAGIFAYIGVTPLAASDGNQVADDVLAFNGLRLVEDVIMFDVNEAAANGDALVSAFDGTDVINGTAPFFVLNDNQPAGDAAIFTDPAFAFGGSQVVEDAVNGVVPIFALNYDQAFQYPFFFDAGGDGILTPALVDVNFHDIYNGPASMGAFFDADEANADLPTNRM